MKIITADILAAHGACADQLRKFKREWPDGTWLLKKRVLRAAELGLNIDWFAEQFLTDAALAEYYKAAAPALWAAIKKHGIKGA